MFRNIWSRIVSIETLALQIKELLSSKSYPKEVEEFLKSAPEFRQVNFKSEARINKFIKSNEGEWLCEVMRPNMGFTVLATISITPGYPETPPIFNLEIVRSESR